MTKSKCGKCDKKFDSEKEGEVYVKEYHNRCGECLRKRVESQNNEKYQEKVLELPKKFRFLKDKYGFNERAIKLKDKSLFLFGETGSGKTVLSTLILKEMWKNNKNGYFISYPELIFEMQTDYDNSKEKLEEVKNYNCVVLDDFGAEKLTDFVRQISYLIINYREQNDLQTIITSNFTLDEIDKSIDRRISSRICGMCDVIEMKHDKRVKHN